MSRSLRGSVGTSCVTMQRILSRIRPIIQVIYRIIMRASSDRPRCCRPIIGGMRTVAGAVVLTCLLAAPSAAGPQPDPALATVLERAGTYVSDLQRQLSAVVGEERYIQTVRDLDAGKTEPRERRTLRSEFLFVRPEGANRYVELRDTFEIDGRPLREGRSRLATLLTAPGGRTGLGVQQIIEASARFNIGDVERTLNVPTLPLLFLHPRFQSRFRFERVQGEPPSVATQPDEPDAGVAPRFRVSTEVWVLAYEETGRPTLVRTPRGSDRPLEGRLWVEPATGRVLMSELIAGDDDLRAVIAVSYQSEPLLGFLVPVEMRERYEARTTGALIEGLATYAGFRPLEPGR